MASLYFAWDQGGLEECLCEWKTSEAWTDLWLYVPTPCLVAVNFPTYQWPPTSDGPRDGLPALLKAAEAGVF